MSAITGPGFLAFSAATQGDWDRAAAAVKDIPVEEWPAFMAAVFGLRTIAVLDMDRERRHRLCDQCEKTNHEGCTGHPCGCTSEVCHPSDPPATPE